MNRFDRITAILVQLHTRRVVKAQDLAERFEISLRTVYRDMRSLEEAGVPIVGEAGIGYSLMEGYKLPPVLFSKEEALALVTAEKMVDKFTDEATQRNYRSALYKIKAVLRVQEKDLLERVEDSILVLEDSGTSPTRPAALQLLLEALGERRVVQMRYHAREGEDTSERLLEPVGVFQQNAHWYLIAYCRLRQAYRTFRTDRMLDVALLPERYRTQHPKLAAYLAEVRRERQLERVVLRVPADIAHYLRYSRSMYGFVSEDCVEDGVEMTFLTATLEGFCRWVMMFADRVQIVEPENLKARIAAHAEGVLKNLTQPESLLT